jgi:ubiquinone/menaquinone biosynthesis C-methylase UbiE
MRMFGRPRGLLGRLGGVIMARANRVAAAEVVELLDVRPNDKVLEVGFGPGVGVRLLSEHAKSRYIAGIDPSKEMVAQAAARNAKAVAGGRVDLRYGSVNTLPFSDATFDKVIAINSMQVWPNATEGLREVRRILKLGGKLALGFTIHSGQSSHGITQLLTAAGFTNPQLVERKGFFCALASNPLAHSDEPS